MAHETEDPKNYLIVAIGLGSIVTLVATMYGLGSYYDVLRDKEQHAKNPGDAKQSGFHIHGVNSVCLRPVDGRRKAACCICNSHSVARVISRGRGMQQRHRLIVRDLSVFQVEHGVGIGQ